ncbi:MAG: hypothetical protein DHS20C14_15270 [Phycisphaeraceae bacterium]|nr:MAG: hypothetical protein DHS20C14_15270 [Phycisphaeraceae bacterium]
MTTDQIQPGSFTVRDSQQRAAQLMQAGETFRAYEILKAILPLDRRDPATLAMLGDASVRLSRLSEGIRHLRLAVELRPKNASIVGLLADTYASTGEVGKAHRTLDAYLKDDPANTRLLSSKARLFQVRGDAQRAYDLIKDHLDHDNELNALTVMYGNLCLALKKRDEGIDRVRARLEEINITPEGRRSLFFSLGHLLDAEGDHDEAFANFERGNKMLDDSDPINAERFCERWSREYIDGIELQPNDSELPVVIVGMPRSGTTLTEQVIAAHPSAAGVGESDLLPLLVRAHSETENGLEGPGLEKIAQAYPAGLLEAALGEPERVVDKLPGNFMNVGVLALALPNAAVIHCRRDARDTCLSCYFQDFGHRQPFTRRQETCAHQFLEYLKVMKHWDEVLDIEILESRYEDLVADPRPHVEALIEHCGLPWNDACLEPHKAKSTVTTASIAQVRRPIYKTSQERWRRYEKHIGPMLELLADV